MEGRPQRRRPDSRGRGGNRQSEHRPPGAGPSPPERARRPRQALLAEKRKRTKELVKRQPRLASRTFVLRVDRFLELYTNKGLEMFQNLGELEKLGLLKVARSGQGLEAAAAISLPESLSVPSLSVCSDQEQVQITGAEFIFAPEPQGLACTGVRLADEFHRWHNDLSMAVALSGLTPIVQAGTLIFNVGYGPWQSHSFFHQLRAEAERVSRAVKPDSQLALRFWPRRRLEDEAAAEDPDPAGARKRWLESLPADFDIMGEKVTPSKWMSFCDVGLEWAKKLASRAVIMSALCMQKGWITTCEDLFASTRLLKVDDGVKPDPKSKAEAVRAAKQKLEALRARTQNTMVTATRLLCDDDVVAGIRLVLHATEAQHFAFCKLVKEFKGTQSTLKAWQGWAAQEWLGWLTGTLQCLDNTVGLQRCGFLMTMTASMHGGAKPEEGALSYQDALAHRLGTLVEKLLALRAGSLGMLSFYYPGKLVGLLSTDEAAFRACMLDFSRDVRAFWAAQEGFPPSLPPSSHAPASLHPPRHLCQRKGFSCARSIAPTTTSIHTTFSPSANVLPAFV